MAERIVGAIALARSSGAQPHLAWSAMGDRMVCGYIPRSMDRGKTAGYIAPEDELFIERNLKKTPEEYFSSNF